MADAGDRDAVHRHIRDRMQMRSTSGSPTDAGAPVERSACASAPDEGRGREDCHSTSRVRSGGLSECTGAGAEKMTDRWAYMHDLVQRLQWLCSEAQLPVPHVIRKGSGRSEIRLDVVACGPLDDDCPASHRVRSWEISEIYKALLISQSPWEKQLHIIRLQQAGV